MSGVFIFHGVGGHENENWFPWLKNALTAEGRSVIVPSFPHPDHPRLDEWLDAMERHRSLVDEQTIFVGHSLGAAFALRYLERNNRGIRAAFLVAPVSGVMGNRFDSLMTTFTAAPYDWNVIRNRCRDFIVIHGKDDPYIRPDLAESLADHLGVSVTEIEKGGHFNAAAGYREFPLLLEKIRSLPA